MLETPLFGMSWHRSSCPRYRPAWYFLWSDRKRPLPFRASSPHIRPMSTTRFILLITLVIASAGLTIWIGAAAAMAGKLNGQVAMALLPLLMLASIAWRGLADRNKD